MQTYLHILDQLDMLNHTNWENNMKNHDNMITVTQDLQYKGYDPCLHLS